jgi:SAM-dependent methyltransferase
MAHADALLLDQVQPMTGSRHAPEQVKPIPVRITGGLGGRVRFALRRSVDLQLQTIWRFLGPILPGLEGRLLDVGCGEMPFRGSLPRSVDYTGIDVEAALAFGMRGDPAIRVFDGRSIPFADASFDHVLCTEVLEHAEDPAGLMAEIHRVLRPGGTLILTVPFAARVHHAPYDFNRFTRYGLAALTAPFASARIEARGNDIATIANKLIVLGMAMLRPSPALLWRAPLAVLLAPVAGAFLVAAHVAIARALGSVDDPLGYAVLAKK